MADRSRLHINKLEDFKKWLLIDGWTIEEPKGTWEVLRARKTGRKEPLIIYTKMNAKEHLTVMDRDRGVVGAYLRDSKKEGKTMNEFIDKIIDNLALERNAESVRYGSKEAIKEHKEQCDFLADLLKKQKNNGWIPCSERLPETNESVLCWAKSTARGGDVCFVGSCHNGFWFLQSAADTHSFPGQYVIIAWQPLPEPYKAGDEE